MTGQEAIETIEQAKANVEWDYPMDYAAAFDYAIECIKIVEDIKKITCTCGDEADNEPKQPHNYQWVVDAWNSLKDQGIGTIKSIGRSGKRYTQLHARIKEYGKEQLLEAIENIRNSDFLCGRSGRDAWRITFDWFIYPTNFIKVLEGKYNNKGERKSTSKKQTSDQDDFEQMMKSNGWA